MGGFLVGFANAVGEGLDRKHQEGEQKKKELRDAYFKVWSDPNVSDAVRQDAWENLNKHVNPDAKKGLAKIAPIFGKLAGHGKQQQGAAQSGAGMDEAPGQVGVPQAGAAPRGAPLEPEGSPGQKAMAGAPGAAPQQAPGAPQPQQAQTAAGQPPPAPPSQPQRAPSPRARAMQGPGLAQAYGADYGKGPAAAADARALQQAEAIERQHFRLGAEQGEQEYQTWFKRGKDLGLQGRDLAEYAGSRGQRLAPQGRVIKETGIVRYDSQGAPMEGSWNHTIEPDGNEHWEKKAETKTNLQPGWAKTPDGQTIAIRIDPRNPGRVLDANTGQQVPEGTKQYNPSEVTAKMRQDSYGTFGNYYRAAKGANPNLSDEEARKIAGQMVDREYGVRLSAQEQNIAIKGIESGVGGGGGGAGTPSATPGTKETPGSRAAGKPGGAAKPAVSSEDQNNISVFLDDVFGTSKAQGPAGARVQKGREALARVTGLPPTQLSAEVLGDKGTAKALIEAAQVAGAFGRVQETLKEHGKVLLDAAKAVDSTGSPIANRTIQWLQQNVAAHPELTKYIIALQAVQREYGRLIAGGAQSRAMLPVASGEKGEHTLRQDATLADISAAVQQLGIEADTEQKAFTQQQDSLKAKLSGGAIGGATGGGPGKDALKKPGENKDPLGILK